MKKALVLTLVALFAISFMAIACDDDDGAACTEDDVNGCYDDYEACAADLDVMSDTYLDEIQACLDDYCDCLDSAGCDMSGYDCGGE